MCPYHEEICIVFDGMVEHISQQFGRTRAFRKVVISTRKVDLGMLLALLVAVCKGDASVRLSAAHAILDWRADSTGVTRSAAMRYARLLRVSHSHNILAHERPAMHVVTKHCPCRKWVLLKMGAIIWTDV